MKDIEKINEFQELGIGNLIDEIFNFETLFLWFLLAIILFVFDVFRSMKGKNKLKENNEKREVTVFELFFTIVMHSSFHGGACGLLFVMFIWYWFCFFCLLLFQKTPLFEYVWLIANTPIIYVIICIAIPTSFLYVSKYHKGQTIK